MILALRASFFNLLACSYLTQPSSSRSRTQFIPTRQGNVLAIQGSGYFRKCRLEECLIQGNELLAVTLGVGRRYSGRKKVKLYITPRGWPTSLVTKTGTDYHILWHLQIHHIYVLIYRVYMVLVLKANTILAKTTQFI